MRFSKFLALSGAALLAFSCGDDDDSSNGDDKVAKIIVPKELTTSAADFYPEDILIANKKLYVSGFANSTIKFFDLTKENPSLESFIAGKDNFAQGWGLGSDGKVLLNNLNNASFGADPSGPSQLSQYDITTGKETASWALPSDGTVAHCVQIVDGKYYINDFAAPRIMELDPATGDIDTDWATFETGTGGIGGMIYNGKDGFYTVQNKKLWFVPIANGVAGDLVEIAVDGIDQIDADGIAWDGDDTIYYVTNDAGESTKDKGVLYKVVVNTDNTATGTEVKTGLKNPSGVWFLENEGKEYVIYAESQFIQLFGPAPAPELPFKITFMEL